MVQGPLEDGSGFPVEDPIEAGWRILRETPPLAAWRLLHRLRAEVLDGIARTVGRPKPPQGLSRDFLGVRVEHPIGIAAGLDKDASMVWLAWSMGAGFHVVGSVLPHPYPGVEPKVLVRLSDGGTINRLGLPSKGPSRVVERLSMHKPPGMPVAVSIAAFTPKGYGEVYRAVSGHAAWVEVNISCPNVETHRTFEDPEEVETICSYLKPRTSPILLKIPPTRDDALLKRYVDAATSCGFQGIVAGNTMKITYKGLNAGLGGPRLFNTTLYMIKRLRTHAPEGFKLIGVGGINNGAKAATLLKAGADLIEVLSAIIHRGPKTPWTIAKELSTKRTNNNPQTS